MNYAAGGSDGIHTRTQTVIAELLKETISKEILIKIA